ncbi:MAG TPA: ATP-binding protein [Enhygromyxa sp.]|nr:ATP-binding protein [Enhygromyxa sp.]
MADARETSDVVALSAELRAELAGHHSRRAGELEALRKRISYFMLFRLGLLAAFTLLSTYTTWLDEDHLVGPRDWVGWSTIAAGYLLTLVFAWQLRPHREPNRVLGPVEARRTESSLRRVAWLQTGFDVAFALIAVALSGGVDSGFVFLFLIAVLGAATMGSRRQIWIIAAASGLSYAGLSLAQLLGLFTWLRDPGEGVATLAPTVLWVALLRTTGAIGLVAILSSYLNTQLRRSVSQIGSLKTLNENIVRSLSSGLLTVDQDGYVLFANPTALDLLGRKGSVDGLHCDELIPGLRTHLDDSGGFRNRFELDIRHSADNRQISLGLTCSPLLDEDGAFLGHIVNYQDVTDLREMERVLRRSERLAALGTLAASVAHEVRNPLAAISGCAELLEGESLSDEDQRLIRVIRRESARLADIVNELLDYTRPRKLQLGKVELGRALTELADSFRADPSHEEIELMLSVPREPVEVELDLSQLTQVLWNLVRNGAQAMAGRGRLELGLQATSEHVRLSVRDFGQGIPAEDLDRIFEPFFSTKAGGTGIGLALVQRIVEEHGGQIEVFSSVGEGTRFVIELPRRGRR